MGINQFSDPGINLGNEGSNNNTDLSIANGHINYGYLIHDGRILHERNIAYYEIPEILIDIVSNGELCIELSCSSQDSNIMFQEDYLHRDSFKNSAQSNNDQMKANYQKSISVKVTYQKKFGTKIHSFLKQCLHNLHFIKTRSFSRNLSISCSIKGPCFDKLKIVHNTV